MRDANGNACTILTHNRAGCSQSAMELAFCRLDLLAYDIYIDENNSALNVNRDFRRDARSRSTALRTSAVSHFIVPSLGAPKHLSSSSPPPHDTPSRVHTLPHTSHSFRRAVFYVCRSVGRALRPAVCLAATALLPSMPHDHLRHFPSEAHLFFVRPRHDPSHKPLMSARATVPY